MSSIESYLVKLKIAYEKIIDNFNNQKEDLFLLKSYTQDLHTTTLDFQANQNENLSKHNQYKLVKLLVDLKRLLNAIEKEIEIQEKEEHFNLKHTEF